MANMPTLSATPTKTNLLPHKDIGPRWLQLPPLVFTSSVTAFTFDLNKELSQEIIDNVQSVYVDNGLNSRAVTISITGSNQTIVIPAGAQGAFPLASSDKQNFTVSTSGQGIVNLWFVNVKLDTAIWGGTSNGLASDASAAFSGSDQTVAPLRPNRLGVIISNQSANPMAVNFSAAAVIGGPGSINLAAGANLILYGGACPCDPIHVIGTLAGNFTVKEIF